MRTLVFFGGMCWLATGAPCVPDTEKHSSSSCDGEQRCLVLPPGCQQHDCLVLGREPLRSMLVLLAGACCSPFGYARACGSSAAQVTLFDAIFTVAVFAKMAGCTKTKLFVHDKFSHCCGSLKWGAWLRLFEITVFFFLTLTVDSWAVDAAQLECECAPLRLSAFLCSAAVSLLGLL